MIRQVIIALLALACATSAAVTIDADNANIRYTGRVDFATPKAPRMDWPGISIEAMFQGTSCGVMLDDNTNAWNVYIDGVLKTPILPSGNNTYSVATGLTDATHSLKLYKRTDGMATFRGLVLDNAKTLVALPAARTHKIEFIGDSYTVGTSDESDGTNCSDRLATNNNKSYAALCADTLGAQGYVLARGGIGLCRNYGSPGTTDPNAYPSFYDRTLPSQATPVWDFAWKPDAVVIGIGTNDFTSQPNPSQQQWVTAYRTLLTRIRGHYPGVQFFCVGMRFDPMISYTKAAVDSEVASGKTDCHYVLFPNWDLYVCDHPNLLCHWRFAAILTGSIKANLGWGVATDVDMPRLTPVNASVRPGLTQAGAMVFDMTGRLLAVTAGETRALPGGVFVVKPQGEATRVESLRR
jgi:hypothetical protein